MGPRTGKPSDEGAVLIEFALIAFVLYLLFAATVDFGRAIQTSQVAQDVARLAARELALTPLPALATFEEAMASPESRKRLYDPAALVVDLDEVEASGQTLDQTFAAMPLINRALRPAMIFEQVLVDGVPRRLLRVPGALLRSVADPSSLTVGVPLVVGRNAEGNETIRWLSVIEEVRAEPDEPRSGPFAIAEVPGLPPPSVSPPDRGLVAVRVNLPFQASALTSFPPTPLAGAPNAGRPHLADDGAVRQLNDPSEGSILDATPTPPAGSPSGTPGASPFAGPFGLGRQFAFATTVRPYRRVVSGQAFFRREVFSDL